MHHAKTTHFQVFFTAVLLITNGKTHGLFATFACGLLITEDKQSKIFSLIPFHTYFKPLSF